MKNEKENTEKSEYLHKMGKSGIISWCASLMYERGTTSVKKKTKSLSLQLTGFVLVDLMMCFLGAVVINLIGKKVIEQYCSSRKCLLQMQKYCMYLLIISIFLSTMFFIVTIFLYTWFKLRYVSLLSQEVQAVEQGELDQEITVRGQDEITVLAESMEHMRRSFAEKLLTIEQMQKDRDHLVTELSHDMRTPLTAMMMYLGFLKEKNYADEETCQAYVNKVYEKAECIKTMMDDLFFYYKMDQKKNCDLEQVPAADLLYEFVEEIAMMLEREGFTVQENMEVPPCNILFGGSYMGRIAGNVVSNVRKYADPAEPVKITLRQEYALVHTAGSKVQVLTLTVRNRKKQIINKEQKEENAAESMGLGLRSIKKMMEQMAGDMFCVEDRGDPAQISLNSEVYYELCLLFRVTDVRV